MTPGRSHSSPQVPDQMTREQDLTSVPEGLREKLKPHFLMSQVEHQSGDQRRNSRTWDRERGQEPGTGVQGQSR